MILIQVSFGTSMAQLLFRTEEKAQAAWTALSPMVVPDGPITMSGLRETKLVPNTVSITDDFGREFRAFGTAISGAIYENLDLSKEAHIEQALHNTRIQLDAQQRANADPMISARMRMGQGPSMLTPFNGRA